jgi:dihydrofolate reductase
MPKLRVHNFAISLDGYGAGPDQSTDNPLGVGGERLHEWVVATRSFRQVHGGEGGDEGLDNQFSARGEVGIGATIMGRNMFGPVRGPWGDDQWTGWWGDAPPFHHPVFVLTHHPRPSITMQGGTTFHFVDDGIEAAPSERSRPPTATTSGWGAAPPPSRSTSGRGSSTTCTWRSCPPCSAAASASSSTSAAARRSTNAWSSSARDPSPTPALSGWRSSGDGKADLYDLAAGYEELIAAA